MRTYAQVLDKQPLIPLEEAGGISNISWAGREACDQLVVSILDLLALLAVLVQQYKY
jgi:hypothetical protein